MTYKVYQVSNRIKQINEFSRRTTDPEAGDLTFSEARDFLPKATQAERERSAEAGPAGPPLSGAVRSEPQQLHQDVADDGGLGGAYAIARKYMP